MISANIHEAKTNLSKLIAQALAGEEVIIARNGLPAVRLTPYQKPKPRILGLAKGQIKIADDFDELPEELLAAFQGEIA